jgi:ABC-type transporter Mla MlaB component
MLRISEMGKANRHVVLKLEGRIVGPWVEELSNACQPLLDRNEPLKLDLADVSYVDREGIALLLRLKGHKVILESCTPFVAQELTQGA